MCRKDERLSCHRSCLVAPPAAPRPRPHWDAQLVTGWAHNGRSAVPRGRTWPAAHLSAPPIRGTLARSRRSGPVRDDGDCLHEPGFLVPVGAHCVSGFAARLRWLAPSRQSPATCTGRHTAAYKTRIEGYKGHGPWAYLLVVGLEAKKVPQELDHFGHE
jgi:hypothetical protein